MKKVLLILSFFIFMFSLGVSIREYRELEKVTIVEYSFYAKKNQNSKYITLKYNSIVDDRLKKIVKKEKEEADCSFDELGVPKCVADIKNNSMKYDKYYIVYYGNDKYKVIYKVEDIDYLDKIIE